MKPSSYACVSLTLLASLLATGCGSDDSEAVAESLQVDTILAVFAHPDDEVSAGPLLAKYAREGKTIYLATVTDGRWGGASNDEEATALAATRALEAQCSTSALGLADPLLLEFEDGEVSENIYAVKATVAGLIASIEPDVLLTWGPEGGYGHKDHRLVSAIVSDVFQAGSADGSPWPKALYYPGIRQVELDSYAPSTQFGGVLKSIWGTTQENYLQYAITVEDEDILATKAAIACHDSQWDEVTQADLSVMIETIGETIYLRKALQEGSDKTALD